jgi:hypothetical protein
MRRAAIAFLVCWIANVQGQKAPATAAQDQALAEIRQYSIGYAKGLPDYTCTRVIEKKTPWVTLPYSPSSGATGPTPGNTGSATTVIEEELVVIGRKENYRVLKIDDDFAPQARAAQLADLAANTISAAEFGSVLDLIFEPESGTSFEWGRPEKLRGRPVIVVSFDVPGSHGEHVYDHAVGREIVVGFKGRVYADAVSKAVLRVETHSSDFPGNSEFKRIDLTLDYKMVAIGAHEYVLPYGFDVRWQRQNQESSVRAGYKDYHGLSAQSLVTYTGANSPAKDEIHSTITFGGVAVPATK